jgi:malonyl-CoA/methylmalonyl-CoA synthetase
VQNSANLYSAFKAQWQEPEKCAIETAGGRRYSFRDLDEVSARIANAYVALGVKPGDRVAAQVEKSPEAMVIYLACLRVGAIYLPLNTAYTQAELEYFLTDAEPALFICRPKDEAAASALCASAGVPQCRTLGVAGDGSLMELAATQASSFEDVARAEDDLAAILYTSGTTGRSKGAMITHRNLAFNAQVLNKLWQFNADDVLLHALPVFHVHGLFVAGNMAFLAGATMLFLPKFDADEVFRLMPRSTVMMGVPTFYVRLLADERLTLETTKGMRLFISGSAPLLPDTFRQFEERTGHAILERYGMTETGMLTSNPYEGGERVAGTVGAPLPGVDVRVVHPETGAILGVEEIGMIEVRGPNVFIGYWRMPEKTKAEIKEDGFFITGDLGKFDAQGYVHIVGRGKDLVISGGYNVYPKEIESEIDAIEGVLESAVIGVPHPDFGEGVVAVVVKAKDGLVEADIMEALKKRLANYKLPKRIIFIDILPRNTMAKVQKNVLRDDYRDIFSG